MEYLNCYNRDYINLLRQRTFFIKVKFEILDWAENTYDEIIYSVKTDDIGQIKANYNQGVRRKISFNLFDYNNTLKPSEDSPFQLYKKFKIYIGIENSLNKDIYWWEQGIFITQDISYENKVLSINGVDKFGIFTDELDFCKLQETYIIPRNTKVSAIINDILLMQSAKGLVYDSVDAIIDFKYIDATLPYDIKKETGGYLGDVLIEIATSLNADIYYDTSGHLRLTPNKDGKYMNIQPQYHFDKDDLINFSVDLNLKESKNIFTVYGYDELEKLHQYTAINDNPLSPIRISLIGDKPNEPEENDMCTNDETCMNYANYLLKKNSVYNLSNKLSCHVIPNLDIDTTIAITDDYYNFDYSLFTVKSFDIPIGVGLTNIEMTNIQYLPEYIHDTYFTNTLYETTRVGINITVPNDNYDYYLNALDYVELSSAIDWGDEQSSNIYLNTFNTHTYLTSDTYDIFIKSLKYIKDSAFKSKNEINHLRLFNKSFAINSLLTIDAFSFYGCENLISIIANNNIELYLSAYSFSNCFNLEVVDLGKDIQYIGMYAFANCSNLNDVTIGSNVKYIGYKAFKNCSNLTVIKYRGSRSQWNNVIKDNDWCDENVIIEYI